jgi:uncharacterized protein YbjT (DUF2867 family)
VLASVPRAPVTATHVSDRAAYPTAPRIVVLLVQVTLQDVGDAAAVILSNPAPHAFRTYNLSGPHYTNAELAAALTTALGRPIDYVQVPYEAAKKSFVDKGWPEWQAGGVMELLRMVDAGAYGYSTDDFTTITGRAPTSVQAWVEAVKGGFAA